MLGHGYCREKNAQTYAYLQRIQVVSKQKKAPRGGALEDGRASVLERKATMPVGRH